MNMLKIVSLQRNIKQFKKFSFRKSSLLFVALFLLATAAAYTTRANAQTQTQGLDLTVSPPVFDLSAKPGDVVKQTFRVRNNQTTPIDLSIEARRLISDPQTGDPTPASDTKGEELSWVTFSPSSFTASPREWTDVTYTINIPKTAAFGYYYVFRITPKNAIAQKTTGASVNGELLVVVLLNVQSDGAIAKADLVKFAPESVVSEYLPVKFNVTVENKGNVHVKPHGNIFITRGGKSDLAILDVNDANGSVLPGGKRTFTALWDDGFIVNTPVMEDGQQKVDKNGKPETQLTINWNKLTSMRIGPYDAHLLLVYDDGKRDQTIEGDAKIMVLPYTFIAVVVVIVVVIIVLIRMVLNSYINSQVRRRSR